MDEIKISGKDYPILICHSAIREFEAEMGQGLHAVDIASLSFFYTMLYCGIKHAHRKKGKESPLKSVDELCDLLDAEDDIFIANVRTQFLKIFSDQTKVGKSEGENKPGAKG